MFNFFKKTIKLDEFPDIEFYPFHQLKKENNNEEPYLKSIKVGTFEYTFFKIKGIVYALKPSSQKNLTKRVACKVKNPITLESATASITGNCARGIKDEFVAYYARFLEQDLDEKQIFLKLINN